MKKTLALLMVFLPVMIAACEQAAPSYEVKGTVPDAKFEGKKLYLLRYDDNKRIDSTVVANSMYVFKGTIDASTYCGIWEGNANLGNLILENAFINMDERELQSTPLNVELNKMNTAIAVQRRAEATERAELFKKITDPQEKKKQNIALKERSGKVLADIYKSYFYANSDNEVGTVAFLGYETFGNQQELTEMIKKAGELVLSREKVKKLVALNTAYRNTDVGKSFVDFTIDQGDGTQKKLSDYVGKGKYVLVDFWASWCAPCLAEIPIITEVYDKYKKKNFEVLGVAVWDDLEKTKKTFEKYNMPWPHILNAGAIPGGIYGIKTIPHIILFAPDGTVVARELRGEELKAKIAEVMK